MTKPDAPDAIAIAEKIADQLRGTCTFLSTALEAIDREELEDDATFCAHLDSLVFCCVRCDWWHEQSEMAERDDDEWICQQCDSEEQ